jgi:hypothetical protein
METMFTIILRGAIQRTYSTEGVQCVRNIVIADQSKLTIAEYGYQCAVAALTIQLIFSLVSFIAFLPWLANQAPVGPAMRAVKDFIYFTTLLGDSNYSDNIRNLCNAQTFAIWQGLDVIVRVGEAVDTQDEDMGRITMDKTKLVRPLVNGRKYL